LIDYELSTSSLLWLKIKMDQFKSTPGILPIRSYILHQSDILLEILAPEKYNKLCCVLAHLVDHPIANRIRIKFDYEFYIESDTEKNLNRFIFELNGLLDQSDQIVVISTIVVHHETITNASSETFMSKTPNKLNRLYFKIGVGDESNTFINGVKDYRGTINQGTVHKDILLEAFEWVVSTGPLCRGNVQGIQIELVDFSRFERKTPFTSKGQLMPGVRDGIWAAILSSKPKLLEPIYSIEINNISDKDELRKIFDRRRATIIEQTDTIIIDIPVTEALGLENELDQVTSIKYVIKFDRWEIITDDPTDQSSRSGKIVADIRLAKGLSKQIPGYLT
jgi:hypothetical protein